MNANSIRSGAHEISYSKYGIGAVMLALTFVFSIRAEYRINVIGLLAHPYLLLLPALIFFLNISIFKVSKGVLHPLFLFLLFFSLGSLQNDSPMSEITKVGAAALTFLFFCQAVKSDTDFRTICWAFLLVGVVIGFLGFFQGTEESVEQRLSGINVLEGLGNKNAQSLYTLPGIFLAIYLLLYYIIRRKYFKVGLLLVAVFLITVQLFLSANRSGWLGLLVILFSYLYYSGISLKTLIVTFFVFLFTYVAINDYAADIFARKKQQTLEGYSSDVGRVMMMEASISAGLEHPIFGLGFDRLSERMAKDLKLNRFGVYRIDSHFLFGYLFGATGIFSLIFFVAFLFSLFKKLLPERLLTSEILKSRQLVLVFVILFLARSFFTREILYSPTFIGALGLLYGNYVLQCNKGLRLWKRQVLNLPRE